MYTAAARIMGIVNRTPDSFFPGSRSAGMDIAPAMRMVEQGADILDIGGESSRPGAAYVSAEEELERVVPFVQRSRQYSDIPISVDTRKAVVARQALAAGANIINDISGLRDDPAIMATAVDYQAQVVIMHMAGTPATMQNKPAYRDVASEVAGFLQERAAAAEQAGIARGNIILDPGIGFGKSLQHNLELIGAVPRLKQLGYPVLLGVSRKSMLGMLGGSPQDPLPVEERLPAGLAVQVIGAHLGADILRVHDVAAARQSLAAAAALGFAANREGS